MCCVYKKQYVSNSTNWMRGSEVKILPKYIFSHTSSFILPYEAWSSCLFYCQIVNDQEPIQANSTSFPKHYAGKELKNQDNIKSNITSRKPRGQLFPSWCPSGYPKQIRQIAKDQQKVDSQLQLELTTAFPADVHQAILNKFVKKPKTNRKWTHNYN